MSCALYLISLNGTIFKPQTQKQKWSHVSASTYQNEDEPHAVLLHSLHQETEVLKAAAEGEVQLPVHVIYVYMLNILQEGASKAFGVPQQFPSGHPTALPGSLSAAWGPQPQALRIYPLTPPDGLSIWLIKIAAWFLHTDRLFPFLLLLPFFPQRNSLPFPPLNSCFFRSSNLKLSEPSKKTKKIDAS